MKTHTLIAAPVIAVLLLAGGAAAGYASIASAQSSTGTANASAFQPHVGGIITAINGTTLTVTAGPRNDGGTFTINASGASVTKDGTSSALSSLVVGDHIMAEGTISGTNVTATKIVSGQKGFGMVMGMGMGKRGGFGRGGVVGEVTAVSGSTITLSAPNGTTYTVNAGGATVQKTTTGSLSDITVGDVIGVQGAVSGTAVTATSIHDDMPRLGAAQQ